MSTPRPQPDSSKEIWDLAIKRYETQTGRKVADDKRVSSIRTLQDLESAAQDAGDRFKAFRNEHHRLLAALKKCLAPLVPIMKLAESALSSTPYAPASIVFSAASYLLDACSTVSKAYDAVQELIQSVTDITTRLNEYSTHTLPASLKTKMVQIVAHVFQVIGTAEKLVRQKRIKLWAKAVILQDDETTKLVNGLKVLIDSEIGLVTSLTYSRVRDIQETTQSIDYQLHRATSGFDDGKIRDELQSDTSRALERIHAQHVQSLAKDTASWIRDDSLFQTWEQKDLSTLWVLGRPGMGKTMLAAKTVEALLDKYTMATTMPANTTVSYLYFKDDRPELQDFPLMLKAAALQATRINATFRSHVLKALTRPEVLASSRQIWESLFLNFFTTTSADISRSSMAFIVVDGLDEARPAQREEVFRCLQTLGSRKDLLRSEVCIKIVIFARPDVRADSGFDRLDHSQRKCIEVTADRNIQDIDIFLRQHLAGVAILRKFKKLKADQEYQSLAKYIFTSVRSRAQGMFLWAKLVLDQIRDLRSQDAIKQSVAATPLGLDKMLHHTFMRLDAIERHDGSYLKYLLAWILCAYTPPSVSSLFLLLHAMTRQRCILLDDDLRDRYASILKVEEPNIGYTDGQGVEGAATEVVGDEEESETEDNMDFLEAAAPDDVHTGSEYSLWPNSKPQSPSSDTVYDQTPNKVMIPFSWTQSQVVFAHARIRDFICTEMDSTTRRWHTCFLFFESMAEARATIVSTCLELLLSASAARPTLGERELQYYVRFNWARHLLDAKLERDSGPAIKVAKMLAELFYDGARILRVAVYRESFVDFLNTWFNTNIYSTTVCRMIVENRNHMDKTMQPWINAMEISTRALFSPLIDTCSRDWLEKSSWDDQKYHNMSWVFRVQILFAYNNLNGMGLNESTITPYGMQDVLRLPPSKLEELAQLSAAPKTEHWLTGMAYAMMWLHGGTEEAISLFQEALRLCPGGAPAFEGLALCYGQIGEFQTAIYMMQNAIDALPKTPEMDTIKSNLRASMLDWQEGFDAEVYEQALNLVFNRVRESPERMSHTAIMVTIKHYIKSRYRARDFDGLFQGIRELDSVYTQDGEKLSLWMGYLRVHKYNEFNADLFDKLGTISLNPDFAYTEDFFSDSIERAADLRLQTVGLPGMQDTTENALQWLLSYGSQERCRTFCKRVVEIIDQSDMKIRQDASELRERAIGELGALYFQDALMAKQDGSDPSADIQLLRDLAVVRTGQHVSYRASTPAMMFGMWQHEYAEKDHTAWMAAIRPSIVQALYRLSESHLNNDRAAYASIGRALLYANDAENARIAFGLAMLPLRRTRHHSHHAATRDADVGDPTAEVERNMLTDGSSIRIEGAGDDVCVTPGLTWNCHACPDSSRLHCAELHFCRLCPEVYLCGACLGRAQTGRLSRRYSGNHEYVQICPLSSDVKRRVNAVIEGRFEERDKWLYELRQRWRV